MNGFLLGVNAVLAGAIVVMATFIVSTRVVTSGRLRRERRFRPAVELAQHAAAVMNNP
jgi:hypothetical protein